MAINSVRTALQLLSGAGELTRARALEAAATLLELPGVGDTSTRASQLAEELLQAATANQQLVHDLVRAEFERQLTRFGLVRGSDLESAQRRIEALEAEVAALRAERSHTAAAPTAATTPRQRPPRSAVRRSAARPTPADTASTAGKTTMKKTTAKKATAKKATTKKTAAKKTTTRTGRTTKSTARAAKKSTARGGEK